MYPIFIHAEVSSNDAMTQLILLFNVHEVLKRVAKSSSSIYKSCYVNSVRMHVHCSVRDKGACL